VIGCEHTSQSEEVHGHELVVLDHRLQRTTHLAVHAVLAQEEGEVARFEVAKEGQLVVAIAKS
jgi:hypothetical protein